METKRVEIATLVRAGHTTSNIIKELNVSKATVCRVRKRLADGDDLKNKPRSGRPVKIRPNQVKTAFEAMPTMKMSELAKKKSVDPSTMSKAKVERPLLTQLHRNLRLDRCQRILSDLKHNGDRKTFTVDPVYNKQNDRVICFGNVSNVIRCVSKTKHPASVMMLGIVASTGDKMPPIWFPTGYRLTGADYLELLKTKITKKSGKSSYVFQQDGAPAHTCKAVQDWMETNMKFWPKTMWPPQSPDLNPLDFSFWWHVESHACRVRHSNVEDLKTSVEKKWKAMKRSYIITVCQAFRRRVEAVIEAKGGEIHK
ncbi:Putative transposable element [Caligus rogercresseyi]|uniref:Transposable element n=1 Tax=Caligus rogercresseyi TaxID=217165 RepID=A0A7T8GXT4_CALRO|nr:Putative transposable element [Caligus rogercresseyi]